jgi:hypothetical protein
MPRGGAQEASWTQSDPGFLNEVRVGACFAVVGWVLDEARVGRGCGRSLDGHLVVMWV